MKTRFVITRNSRISPRLIVRFLLLLAIVMVAEIVTGPAAIAQSTLPRPNHVLLVIEENRSFSDIIGSASAPYINTLAKSGATFSNSFAITHPSEPNYLALFSGSTEDITDDSCPHTFSGPDLGGSLHKAGLSFAGYSESMGSSGYTGCQYPPVYPTYARKHNPWVNFTDVPASDNLPWTSFPTNYNTLPTISIVVPNLLNDMHDGTIQQGDTWLQQHLDGYVRWAKTHNSLLLVTWDEDDGSARNQIATITVGPMVKAGTYSEIVNHYRLLRTLEDMYKLPYAHNSANVQPIADIWR
jgi:hypothetical protein